MVKMDSTSLDLSGLGFSYWGAGDVVEINGTGGTDTIIGSSANDVIRGAVNAVPGSSAGTNDSLSGGGGDDKIIYLARANQTSDGGEGNDTLALTLNISPTFSQLTSLVVDLAAGTVTETVYGTRLGIPPVPYTETQTQSAVNFENADFALSRVATTLTGSDVDNTLIAGTADDTLTGGLGADTLTGGTGADSFLWNNKLEGGDTITDFEQGADKLAFTSGQFGVVGAFDTAVDADPGANVDLSSADLVYTGERLNSTAEVRSFVDGQNASASHGMFVFARNSADHAILYYSSNASEAPGAVGDTAFYQIADLGTGPFVDLSLLMGSFIFV